MSGTITVLGGGSWGTAVATLLAHNGYKVMLWCHEPEVVADINNKRINTKFLSNVRLHENIVATSCVQDAVKASGWIFEAIPIRYLRTVLMQAKQVVTRDHKVVVLSKGIESESLLFPVDVVKEVWGVIPKDAIAVLGGPNFANELAEKIPTATVIAAPSIQFAQEVARFVQTDYFQPYPSTDVVGVEVGGAFKNVIAVAMGIAHGVGYKNNTIAYLFCQGVSEVSALAQVLGGKIETIYGLAGFGDMFLCSLDSLSKNFKIGKVLGQGYPLCDLATQYPVLPEGINTLQSIKRLTKKYNLRLPLCQTTHEFVFEGTCFKRILFRLMPDVSRSEE
jgi:glycerol-3-phosphate dehydrogenase (NAD(P)+)